MQIGGCQVTQGKENEQQLASCVHVCGASFWGDEHVLQLGRMGGHVTL